MLLILKAGNSKKEKLKSLKAPRVHIFQALSKKTFELTSYDIKLPWYHQAPFEAKVAKPLLKALQSPPSQSLQGPISSYTQFPNQFRVSNFSSTKPKNYHIFLYLIPKAAQKSKFLQYKASHMIPCLTLLGLSFLSND